MIFTLNDLAVRFLTGRLHSKGMKPMNRLRCLLFAMVVISSSTLALGGEMQAPGKSEPPPPPSTPTTQSTTDGATTPTSTDKVPIASQDLTTEMLLEILLTIY